MSLRKTTPISSIRIKKQSHTPPQWDCLQTSPNRISRLKETTKRFYVV